MIKFCLKYLLTLPATAAISFFIAFSAFADISSSLLNLPNIDKNTQNFLGPIAKIQIAAPLTDNTAGALLLEGLEAGGRNYRGSATWGWDFADQQRLKFTGEYLRQDIDYAFLTGPDRQWVQQSAVGLDYEYELSQDFLNHIDFSGYYSHAPSVNLDAVSGSYVDSRNNTVQYTDFRRIAGSNAYGVSPELTLNPWSGAEAVFALNYDDVNYDYIYTAQKHVKGFGGTVNFNQALGYNLKLNLSAGIRTPFDAYQAGINYVNPFLSGDLSLGLIGAYTKGKDFLPDTSMIGLQLNYVIQKASKQNKNGDNVKNDALSEWVNNPAVYMPQVLAVPEEKLIIKTISPPSPPSFCPAPVFNGPIPDYYSFFTNIISYPIANYFNGNGRPLTFSASFFSSNLPGDYLSINPSTGVITGNIPYNYNVTVIVTATNNCGHSILSNLFLIIYGNPDI